LKYEFFGPGAPMVNVDVSRDVLDITGERLNRLPIIFGVATEESSIFSSTSLFDGIIGLALDSIGHIEEGVSALTRLTNSSQRPSMFGLFLSDSWDGSHGLAIGGLDTSKFWNPEEVPVLVPVLRSATSQSFDLWRISIPHVSMTGGLRDKTLNVKNVEEEEEEDVTSPLGSYCGDGSGQGSYGGPVCEAILDISSGFIGLPLLALESILSAVNSSVGGQCVQASQTIGGDYSLDCPALFSHMPNLTFTVAGDRPRLDALGKNFFDSNPNAIPIGSYYSLSLTPNDYCVQNWTWNGNSPVRDRTTCRTLLSVTNLEEGKFPYKEKGDGSSSKSIFVLGAPFLRAFYTLYDSSQSGYKAVGFASVRSYGISPSSWKPPPTPSPSPSANSNGVNYNEVWAGVAGVAVGLFIAVGVYFIIRDRFSQTTIIDNAGYGLDDAGSLMIDDRDDDEFDADYDELDDLNKIEERRRGSSGGSGGVGGGGGGGGRLVETSLDEERLRSPLRLGINNSKKGVAGSIQFLDVQ
jgi:hypothetical protein